MPYTHLTQSERYQICALRGLGRTVTQIALTLIVRVQPSVGSLGATRLTDRKTRRANTKPKRRIRWPKSVPNKAMVRG